MQAVKTNEVLEIMERGRKDPAWFLTHILDVKEEYLWWKMKEMCNSVRDHERVTIGAGHGVSKTFSMARLALWFLYCYYPSTVVTTAPTDNQVKNLLWREIRAAHTAARVPLGGHLTTQMLDMQRETGVIWYATGFSTKPDTVTQEATAFQGIHNDHVLIIFDEAAGILPEIWRAAEHIGAPFKRFVAVGNPTTAGGEFAASLKDKTYHQMRIAVTDTPNFKQGKTVIPGLYGREYEQRIRLKYGEDSDEYKVRVLGLVSAKHAEGAYYAKTFKEIRKQGRVGRVRHDPNHLVYPVWDVGYTTALWFVQPVGTDFHIIKYYEDSGLAIKDYVDLFDELKRDEGYHFGDNIVPCDMDSNALRVITGQTALETLRNLNYSAKPLKMEGSISEGIIRTTRFLHRCWFDDENCELGIERLESYHERKNKAMSTEDNPVFTGVPEKDGPEHGADAFRYVSMAAASNMFSTSETSKSDWQALKEKYA